MIVFHQSSINLQYKIVSSIQLLHILKLPFKQELFSSIQPLFSKNDFYQSNLCFSKKILSINFYLSNNYFHQYDLHISISAWLLGRYILMEVEKEIHE